MDEVLIESLMFMNVPLFLQFWFYALGNQVRRLVQFAYTIFPSWLFPSWLNNQNVFCHTCTSICSSAKK